MSESKFKTIQEDVCLQTEKEQAEEIDKICPTCIPNENYMEPDWTQTNTPYLNEKRCEYQLKTLINVFGDIHVEGDSIPPLFTGINDSEYEFTTLLKSYIRPAIRDMLRYYGKLETDDVVCASPPQSRGERCKGIFNLDYEGFIKQTTVINQQGDQIYEFPGPLNIDPNISQELESVTNLNALELYGRVLDYTFLGGQKTLAVLVSIPAYVFDKVPSAPDLGSANTSVEKVTIRPLDFMVDIIKFKSAMKTFSSYQSFFKQKENASIYFQESGSPFYIKYYAEERIDKFISKLDALLNNNNFELQDVKNPRLAEEVEISFDNSDEKNPFIVKNVRAKLKNCPYIECSQTLNTFIEYSKTDQTMMGYIANITKISRDLASNQTPPWLDFTINNTFPQLAVNYGSTGKFEDSCVNLDFSKLDDFILNETMDLAKALSYRVNQIKCKDSYELNGGIISTLDLFSNPFKAENAWPATFQTDNEGNVLQDKNGKPMLTPEYSGLLKSLENLENGLNSLKSIPSMLSKSYNDGLLNGVNINFKDLMRFLNPCNFKDIAAVSLKCIMAGLTLEESYYAILKKMISSGGTEVLETIISTLSATKQQQIRDIVDKEFKGMPSPWESEWKGGNLGSAVRRTASDNVDKKIEKLNESEGSRDSIQKQIDDINKELESLKKFDIEAYHEELLSEGDNLQAAIPELESHISFNLKVISEYETIIDALNEAIQFIQENVPSMLWSSDEEYNSALRSKFEANRKIEESQLEVDSYEQTLEKYRSRVIRISEIIGNDEKQRENADNIVKLESKKNDLFKKKHPNDIIIGENAEYKDWTSKTDEEKQAIIDAETEKTSIVQLQPTDEIQQGTLGKALGNVQQAVVMAYIDAIMETASIGELTRIIEGIPGANLLGKLIGQFNCPRGPMIYPPIESFLSTLTFDPCGPEKIRIALPSIPELPTSWNWLEQLGDLFYFALKKILNKVLMALIMKLAQMLQNRDFCGELGNITRKSLDGGLQGVLEEYLCDDINTKDSIDNSIQNILSNSGAVPGAGVNKEEAYRKLTKALSVSSSMRDIKRAMTGQADPNFISGIVNVINSAVPEFSATFSDSSTAINFFNQLGNLLTHEQRQSLIDSLDEEDDFPVETSICLTKEERDQWDQERIEAFSDPEIGREFVNKQNEKALSDLADAADLLMNGPDDALQNALDDALSSKDPDCKINKSVVPSMSEMPAAQKALISNAIEGTFKRLEKAFIDDTIEWNWMEFWDTPGLLSIILSDKANRVFNHYLAARNAPDWIAFFMGGKRDLPKTIAIQLKNQIDSISGDYRLQQPFNLYFTNGKGKDSRFESIVSNKYESMISITDTVQDNFLYRIGDERISVTVDNNNVIPEEYQASQSELGSGSPYRLVSMQKMFSESWAEFSGIDISSADAKVIYEGINHDLYNNMPKMLTVGENGQIANGYLYGNDEIELTEEDFEYVGPNGEEYNYSEDEKVLGRSKTNHPNIHFLDPAKYGGTYTEPQIYIEEAKHSGWTQFSKIVIPNPTGCNPKNSNFLMLDDIMKKIDKVKGEIPFHEGLSTAPECTKEYPFDKIAGPETLATLEGIVRATIRVYLSDFLIRSMPIYSNVLLDLERNYDDSVTSYLSELIFKGLVQERSFFSSTYEGYTYALLFLEQIVQIVDREVKSGTIEENDEIREALLECKKAQEDYKHIKSSDLIKFLPNYMANVLEKHIKEKLGVDFDFYKDEVNELSAVVKSGITIIGSGDSWMDIFERAEYNLATLGLDQARFASKIFSVYTVELQCKKLMKYVIEQEIQKYSKKMREEISPRPYIYDIRKYYIGASNMMLGNQIKAGIYDIEIPIGGGKSAIPYGTVNDCAKRDMIHPLNGASVTQEQFDSIKKRGGFYIEKYLIIKEKDSIAFKTTTDITNHPRGVVNLTEFKEFLTQNRADFDLSKNISDYFGDAVLSSNGGSYEGSIGIKMGVRLCYVPFESFAPFASIADELSSYGKAQDFRSYLLTPPAFDIQGEQMPYEAARYSFPIASYEKDILDDKMSILFDTDEDLNQEIKCYIDGLVRTKQFKHFADNIINIPKVTSALMIYSYNNILFSLGTGDERDNGDDEDNPIESDELEKIYNDSKREARKLFAAYYKNNDRDPPDEESNNTDILSENSRRIAASLTFIDFGSLSFNIRRRIKRENPFDKDGNECKNNFEKLYSIKPA